MTTLRCGFVVIIVCAATARASAQNASTRCSFTSERASTDSTAGVGQVGFLGGNVVIRCPARGILLRGDSAERRPDGEHMIGHAIYDEPRFHVTADYLNYFPDSETVKAVGSVKARLPNGSTLVGPIAEYRRPVPRVRPHQQVLAIARPTINIVQKDSTKKTTDTTVVVANQVFMDGDSLIYAGGQVVITRPDIAATSDSAFIDQRHDIMHLITRPTLKGNKGRSFSLSGGLIDLYSRNHTLQRVIARANAVALTDSMTLKADTIDLRVRNDVLDHAYAWGSKDRARVVSATQNVLADSLDVAMPGQKIQLVRALRKAFAQSKPDTTRFRVEGADSTDWLRGDTIVAHFDSLPAHDTAKTPPIKLLVASGHASSLYHIAASDSAEKRPAINYVDARTIIVHFDKQRVSTVTAVDSVHGIYIEPKPDSTTKRAKPVATPGKTPAPAKKPLPSAAALPPKRP